MKKQFFLKKVETGLEVSKYSKYTIRNYMNFLSKFLYSTKKPLDKLNRDDVIKYMKRNLINKSPSTIIIFLSALRYSFLTIFERDLTATIRFPRRDKKIPPVLTKKEVIVLIKAVKDKNRLMVSLIYGCGLRVSEISNLKVNDLNFPEREGFINQGKWRRDRFFNIPESLLKELKNQVKTQKENNQEYLFSGKNGPVSMRKIEYIVKMAAQVAGINKSVHVHTLRHSYATHLLENHIDIRKIQELLGHSDLRTTQVYLHLSRKEIKKVKSPLDR